MIQAARDLEANLILITYLPHRLGLPFDDFQQHLGDLRLMLCSADRQLIKTAVQHLSGTTENMRVPAGATFVAIDGVNAK